ncbi:MAG: ParB/RepB/Spo0J family partition protein [Desulfobacterales bacterium]
MKSESSPPAKKAKKKALGMGIEALIPDIASLDQPQTEFFACDIDRLRANPYQPRRHFAEEELRELSQSIKEQGVLQPLLVRRNGTALELVAGERRLRAARSAGLAQVPVVVREISDAELLVISIVENIQRENLNPMEEAEAYQRLMSEFDLTQEAVALKVGKSRPAVANFLRLRQLPEPIKANIMEGSLSMGHARALLGADTPAQQTAAWRTILAKKLSVRETERLIKRLKAEAKPAAPVRPPSSDEIYFQELSQELSRNLGTKVNIIRKGQKGRLEIDFYSDQDLERLLAYLKGDSA